jgi:CRISPR/Cas system endoribonuclease Cas6 (RAMP superfamily)
MEKSDAEAMMKSLLMMGDHLNKLEEFSKQLSTTEEEKRFRRHLGEVMAGIYVDLMLPIIKKFPDLDPDK